ncbi:FAM175 family [Senna tora]|uniref:FAM175 family n=1 Tax=Senna tora TaxID=362788 RepID=A0A835CM68_9FABA|nr:FAM175 family [Senna tora]
MAELSLHKIAISGPTLASVIQSFSTSPGAVDGLLFGHVTYVTPSTLSDDSASESSTLVATITGFLCSGTINSFYDSTGTVDPSSLHRLLIIGWFSGRRKTNLRPSMREFAVTASLSSMTQFAFSVKNAPESTNFNPCVFLLLSSPLADQPIHTHEYRGYQFRKVTESFDPKSMDIVNIGPAFRGHYGSFSPNAPFPSLACDLGHSPMNEDKDEGSLNQMKQVLKEQKELDICAEGFQVGSLSRLMGSEATNYTAGLENLYEKMLLKVENLARQVERSSAQVLEQENHNRRLRYKFLKSVVPE